MPLRMPVTVGSEAATRVGRRAYSPLACIRMLSLVAIIPTAPTAQSTAPWRVDGREHAAHPSSAIPNSPVGALAPPRLRDALARLPLSFEPNRGQTDSEVEFLARGQGYALFLTPTEA